MTQAPSSASPVGNVPARARSWGRLRAPWACEAARPKRLLGPQIPGPQDSQAPALLPLAPAPNRVPAGRVGAAPSSEERGCGA